MSTQELHVVTGAFGYSGKYLAARLLKAGHRVRTLTNSLQRANPFGSDVEARPFHFDEPAKLVDSLRGAAAGWLIGKLTGDVLITREEIEGLMQNLLCTNSPPAGTTALTAWAREHAQNLGRHYASELARRRDRRKDYAIQ